MEVVAGMVGLSLSLSLSLSPSPSPLYIFLAFNGLLRDGRKGFASLLPKRGI
jgi:hypothetical protein